MSGRTYQKEHRIETPRLTIRSASPDDAQGLADLRGNPKNEPFGQPDSTEASVYLPRIAKWAQLSADGARAFTVIELSSGDRPIIGFGGFNEFRWGKSLDGARDNVLEVDIGAGIDNAYWRQGFAREAFVGMVDYSFGQLGADYVSCDTCVSNEPWRGLMRSLGLQGKEKRTVFAEGHPVAGQECWLWQFDQSDWVVAKEVMVKDGKWPL